MLHGRTAWFFFLSVSGSHCTTISKGHKEDELGFHGWCLCRCHTQLSRGSANSTCKSQPFMARSFSGRWSEAAIGLKIRADVFWESISRANLIETDGLHAMTSFQNCVRAPVRGERFYSLEIEGQELVEGNICYNNIISMTTDVVIRTSKYHLCKKETELETNFQSFVYHDIMQEFSPATHPAGADIGAATS